MLLLPRAWVQSVVGELRPHKPCGMANKTKQKITVKGFFLLMCGRRIGGFKVLQLWVV